MLFLPLILTNDLSASLNPSSIDYKYDIPFAIPAEIGYRSGSLTKVNPVNHTVDDAATNSQTKTEASNDRISTMAICDQLPISTVTAIGNDGNVPSNAIDNNLNTRWSKLGHVV